MVRKHLGYAHIPQCFAEDVNVFCQRHVNPYVHFQRPCFFPETVIDSKGKERKRYLYKHMQTPFEKLCSLDRPEEYLKPGVTIEQLKAFALSKSDNEAADAMNKARERLFQSWATIREKRA